MSSLYKIQASLIEYGCMLLDSGLIVGTWGNLSVRLPKESDHIAITPSGRSYRNLVPGDILVVNIDGEIVEGVLKPSSELPLHLAIYRARSDVHAIVHTHSTFASACAVARRPIPPLAEDLAMLAGGVVEVAEYARNGTAELAANAVRALGDKNAVLLANHGVVGCGATLNEAKVACELVEKTAQIFIYANLLPGGAKALEAGDVAAMHADYRRSYRQK